MFERLFQRPFALSPHLNGPLVEERRRFLCHRADQGFSRNGLRVLAYYLLACTHYLRLGDRPAEGICFAEVEEQATLWANRLPHRQDTLRRRSSRGEFLRHACAWLRFLGRLQPPATPRGPFADHIATFADFLLGSDLLKLTPFRAV
jgi:integrase/recombinase XerD